MIKVGIVGGAGYTAGELLRILLQHPNVEIVFIYSTSNAMNYVSSIHKDLFGDTDMKFTSEINPIVDVIFLCLGHGNSKKFIDEHKLEKHVKIIDLSHDFRLRDNSSYKGNDFVYALPELHKEKIAKAQFAANPGCFATGIQLALLPLVKRQILNNPVHVHAITGSTGAGVSLSSTNHFSWRNNNLSAYKVFSHQHLAEINQNFGDMQPNWSKELNLIPIRGNFTRGIFITAYTKFGLNEREAYELYQDFYKESPFCHISKEPVHLKQVVNSNKCILHIEKHDKHLLITSIIDNLLKGASGQAVQNMNLMFGIEETTGLKFKGVAF